MTHYNVVIATPGYSLHRKYVESLTNTIAELDRHGISWRWINHCSSHVGHAREMVAGMIGEDTYDKIFWIDSDIAWTPEDFMLLYRSELDIVTGAYVGTALFICAATEWDRAVTKLDILNATGPIELMHCGFGFICIKRGVTESLSHPIFQSVHYKKQFLYSEDVSWCLRVAKNGYRIWLDPRVRVGHYKEREQRV